KRTSPSRSGRRRGFRRTNLQAEEIRQQLWPLNGEETLGMELHSIHGRTALLAPSQAHDLFRISPRADLKVPAQRAAIHDERVVSRGGKWIGQSLKNPPAIVVYLGCLAMHQHIVALDRHPMHIRDGLVPQTHSQDWDLSLE